MLDIPASVTQLSKGAGGGDMTLPGGAFHVANSNGLRQYSGPLPPVGDHPHRYFFVVHALDVPSLGLDSTVNATIASFTLGMHTLGRAILVGTYQR